LIGFSDDQPSRLWDSHGQVAGPFEDAGGHLWGGELKQLAARAQRRRSVSKSVPSTELIKAKTFGIHTDMYRITSSNLGLRSGYSVTFDWIKDA
jgi:hypothetical protein